MLWMDMNVEKTNVTRLSKHPSAIQIDRTNQPENVKCFNYLGSMLTNDARHTREIKPSIVMTK
jgi:hypothetical protein